MPSWTPQTVRELKLKTFGTVSQRLIRGTVSQLCPLRQREFCTDGRVLNFTLTDASGIDPTDAPVHSIRVFLYDQWASGLSFIQDGDTIEIGASFELFPNPCSVKAAANVAQLPREEALLGINESTVVVVEQATDVGGDIMQLTVDAATIDNPAVRVKRPKADPEGRNELVAGRGKVLDAQ